MFTSRRRAIKIYVYRNANSNVNQEAAKLLISRGNFLRAATTMQLPTGDDTTCMFACVQTGGGGGGGGASAFCLSVYDLREGDDRAAR